MIGNIIEYVHSYGYFDFKALPFNVVDALVLGQFVYLKIEGIVGGLEQGSKPITLKDLQAHEQVEKLFSDPRWEENNRVLFKEMCESKRFGELKLMYCENHTSTEGETQFMAVTSMFPDGSIKILYRGTDETIVGWKEDFNMAFQYPIPGQSASCLYLEQVSKHIKGNFDLLGHSKGGNLAVYAAMHVDESVRDRIGTIYNLDGPGFRTEVYSMGSFEQIADRIIKIIPHSSIVGMLLENHGEYKVVDSKSIGFLQHDPFSWLVDRIDFVYLEGLDEKHRILNESLNEWVMGLSTEEVAAFVNTLYQIVAASEATDIISFTKNWTKSLAGMAGAIQNLDEETKNSMHKIMKSLASVSKGKIKEETGLYIHSKIEALGQRIGKEGAK